MTTYTADDFKHAHFAMHSVTGSVASKGRMDWKWVLPGWYDTGDVSRLSDQQMADAGWAPVRVPAGSYTRTDEEDWQARAVKAEQALVEMTAHRDQCRGTAIKWQMEANRAEAQAAIRGRAVQIYQQRARTAEAERDQERKWRLELDAAHDEEIENAEKAEARIKAVETMRDTLHLNYTTMSGPAVAAALTRALTA